MSPQRRTTGSGSGRTGGRRGEFGRRYTPRRKVCAFCVDKITYIDYKDVARLRRYLSERGKIEPRRKTGNCAKHQRALAVSLKRARHVALLPYTAEHIRLSGMIMRSPDDRRRDDRGPRPSIAPPPAADVRPAGLNGAVTPPGVTADGAAVGETGPVAEAAPMVEAAPMAEDRPAADAPVAAPDAGEAGSANGPAGTTTAEGAPAQGSDGVAQPAGVDEPSQR